MSDILTIDFDRGKFPVEVDTTRVVGLLLTVFMNGDGSMTCRLQLDKLQSTDGSYRPYIEVRKGRNLLDMSELVTLKVQVLEDEVIDDHVAVDSYLKLAELLAAPMLVNGVQHWFDASSDSRSKHGTGYVLRKKYRDQVRRAYPDSVARRNYAGTLLNLMIDSFEVSRERVLVIHSVDDLRERGVHVPNSAVLPDGQGWVRRTLYDRHGEFYTVGDVQVRFISLDVKSKSGNPIAGKGMLAAPSETWLCSLMEQLCVDVIITGDQIKSEARDTRGALRIGMSRRPFGMRQSFGTNLIVELMTASGQVVEFNDIVEEFWGGRSPHWLLLDCWNPELTGCERNAAMRLLMAVLSKRGGSEKDTQHEKDVWSLAHGLVEAGLDPLHPTMINSCNDMIMKRASRLLRAMSLPTYNSVALHDTRLRPKSECCIPGMDEGWVVVYRSPIRHAQSCKVLYNRHLPGMGRRHGVFIHPDTLLSIDGDHDGDLLTIIPIRTDRMISCFRKMLAFFKEEPISHASKNHIGWVTGKRKAPADDFGKEFARWLGDECSPTPVKLGQVSYAFYAALSARRTDLAREFSLLMQLSVMVKHNIALGHDYWDVHRAALKWLKDVPKYIRYRSQLLVELPSPEEEAFGDNAIHDLYEMVYPALAEREAIQIMDDHWDPIRNIITETRGYFDIAVEKGLFAVAEDHHSAVKGTMDDLFDNAIQGPEFTERMRCLWLTLQEDIEELGLSEVEKLVLAATYLSRAHGAQFKDERLPSLSSGFWAFKVLPQQAIDIIQSIYRPEHPGVNLQEM